MSLMRRFSNRMTGKSSENNPKKGKQKAIEPVELQDAPVPTSRQMTTSNLFSEIKSTSGDRGDMARTLYEIPQPSQVDAMTDHIKAHQSGDLFPYVGVVGSEGESSDARRARLLALKPSYNKRDIPEIKILGCPLISKEGDFTLDTLMKFAKANTAPIPASAGPVPSGIHSADYTITKDYVHIKQVTILFSPNVSSSSNYCNFWMNLIDHRLINSDKGSQSNAIVSNQEGIMEMSCDYCVPARELSNFSISYTLERDVVHPGFQWGTASFYFSITESDLPFQSSKVDSMAVYRMPITTLMERKTNADKSDITFTPADIEAMREMYQKGDIVDVDAPQVIRAKKSVYTKSMRTAPKGEKLESGEREGWGFMKDARKPEVDAMEASVDVESDEPIRAVDQDLIKVERKAALERYKARQEEERAALVFQDDQTESIYREEEAGSEEKSPEQEPGSDLARLFSASRRKKEVQFGASGV